MPDGDARPKAPKKNFREQRDSIKQKRDQSDVRAIRVEIARPIENPDNWDDLGGFLRRAREKCGRLLRTAWLEYVFSVQRGQALDSTEGSSGEPTKGGSAGARAYQAVGREICQIQDWAKKKLEAQPTKPLKDSEAEKTRLRTIATLKSWSEFDLAGGTQSAIAQAAALKASEWLKGGGAEAFTNYKNHNPIPVRRQEYEIIEEIVEREIDGKTKKVPQIFIRMKLFAGREIGWTKVLVRPTKGSHWGDLRKLIKGQEEPGYKPGALKLVYDENSLRSNGARGKWAAIIAFSKPKALPPAEVDPEKILVVHRGLYNMLSVASSSATNWKCVESGFKYLHFKRKIEARQREIRGIQKAGRGTGACGHGRKRRYATYDALDTKITDFRKTFIQTAWARILELAKIWGCGTIVIEDYGTIETDVDKTRFVTKFPWAEVKTWGESVCKREGFAFRETSAAYISQCCPRCGHTEDSGRQVVRRRGMFHCQRCNFERPLDMVSTIHMLRRAAPKVNAWDDSLAREFKTAKSLGQVKETLANGAIVEKPKRENARS